MPADYANLIHVFMPIPSSHKRSDEPASGIAARRRRGMQTPEARGPGPRPAYCANIAHAVIPIPSWTLRIPPATWIISGGRRVQPPEAQGPGPMPAGNEQTAHMSVYPFMTSS
jgi:hypothetical protein